MQPPEPHHPFLTPQQLETDLVEAAEQGNAKHVRKVLAQYKNQGLSPRIAAALMVVLQGSRYDVVRALLSDSGPDVDLGAEFVGEELPPFIKAKHLESGTTPLMVAAGDGNDFMVKALLDAGANANKTSQSGLTPLVITAGAGHTETVRLLLEAGANVNAVAKGPGTALIAAAQSQSIDIVGELLAAGADADAKGMDGKTATDVAVDSGRIDIAERLGKAQRSLSCIRVGGNVPFPAKLHHAQSKIPEFPPNIKMPLPFFIFEAIIDEHGNVDRVRVLRATTKPTESEAKAIWISLLKSNIEAIKKWKYAPTVFDEKTVCVRMTVTVHFGSR